MIKINGLKGIWTLSEVIDLLHDADVEFKLTLDSQFKLNHVIEDQLINNNLTSDINDKFSLSDNGGN